MTSPQKTIRLTGLRQNNLKNFDVTFPLGKISVITGLSGSGKSTLAFDTLYAEGQRRYIESLSTYTRQFLEKMPKAEFDTVENIPPAIALEQRNHVMNSRSTVGTQTEIVDYLRVLFSKIGLTFCLDCGKKVKKVTPQSLLTEAEDFFPSKKAAILAPILLSPSKKKKTAKEISINSLLGVFRDQGVRRVLWIKKKSKIGDTLDLEDLDTPDFPKIPKTALARKELFLMVDRLKITPEEIENERPRLLESVERAAHLGQGQVVFYDLSSGGQKQFSCGFSCTSCGKEHRVPEPNLFSFNSPVGACSSCSGFGHTLDLDESLIVPDPTKTLKNGAIDPFSKPSLSEWERDLLRFCERHGISSGKRYAQLTARQKDLIWNGDPKDKTFPGIISCFEYLAKKKYKLHIRVFIRRYQSQTVCQSCEGTRLQPEAHAVKIQKKTLSEILDLSVSDALQWFQKVKLTAAEKKISEDINEQVVRRLHFLDQVGVGYLTLSRLAKTLSGGEFQRINLATQLGNGLCGTLYVLDEPSIGLHPSDTDRLIEVIQSLRDQGNTVVIVEHDLDVMRAADWLVELGPGAGRHGGELIAQGNDQALIQEKGSVTGKYLSGAFQIERVRTPRPPAKKQIRIKGCRENNLKDVTAEFPLERLTVVTGVSGSGKTTLVHKTLYHALGKIFAHQAKNATKRLTASVGEYDQIYGAENIRDVVLLDQKPIGKNSRSNPATYLKAWDEVRRVYANQVSSIRRGYTPQHFSFNVEGGRCPVCKGEGEITLDMHFMAEIKIPCEECGGKRFKRNILEVTYKNKNISQLLETTIDEAFDLFRGNPVLTRKLGILRDVGLGYLNLGQSATTLSGGESQRLKIASVLDSKNDSQQLFIFDEPTTGLHFDDIKKLLYVMQDLVDSGNTIILIEHHLDIIAQADWIIDLGPEGGEKGGQIIASGPPQSIIKKSASITGKWLTRSGYTFPDERDTR